jgi:acetyl/propionyl-CoA carboxylase alpha subunit
VPFLFWRAEWFGRRLDDKEIDRYLTAHKPRLVQQAVAQIAERIIKGEMSPAAATQWYPRVAALGNHPLTEMRCTVAWVMGQDNTSAEFHQALLRLLRDPEVLVRRNAALSLVRFADPSGRQEILTMLHPYAVRSAVAGILSFRVGEQDSVNPGSLLAKLDTGGKEVIEVRSPLPGKVDKMLVAERQSVAAGDQLILLAPAPEQVWEALRALVLVGRPEDLPEVEKLGLSAGDGSGVADKIRQQANLTAQAIRNRP